MSDRHRGQEDDIQDERPVLRVSPEPTEEELAAITSAVLAISRSLETADEDVPRLADRWYATGRREALRAPLERRKRNVLT